MEQYRHRNQRRSARARTKKYTPQSDVIIDKPKLSEKNCQSDPRRSVSARAKKYTTRNDIIIEKPSEKNCQSKHRYRKLKMLGKGGFAKVYRVEDMDEGKKYALKIVEKKGLQKKNREKLSTEIKIHSSLDHRYICKFIRFFEDKDHVYLLLELCDCETLMEVLADRKRLSELEAKYFMYQLILAMVHMHKKRIIHRDMKLGNIFLDDQLDVKIGDFGLAAQLSFEGQRKRTLCGTPNYIAPEILMNARNGHSYEVDVWSLGVILFTLLVGKPPFETNSVKRTYRHIRRIKYEFPPHIRVSHEAREVIQDILQRDPFKRPTVFELLDYPFFNDYRPFPASEILQVPRSLHNYVHKRTRQYPTKKKRRVGSYLMDDKSSSPSSNNCDDPTQKRRKYGDDNNTEQKYLSIPKSRTSNKGCGVKPIPVSPHKKMRYHPLRRKENERDDFDDFERINLQEKENGGKRRPKKRIPFKSNNNKNGNERYDNWLYRKLETSFQKRSQKMNKKKKTNNNNNDHDDDLLKMKNKMKLEQQQQQRLKNKKKRKLVQPKIWVQDIADYSKKYGLAYRYNTGIVGAFFNDYTMMLYNPSLGTIKYFIRIVDEEEKGGVIRQRKTFQKEEYTIKSHPESMKKKMTLIKYFHGMFEKTKGSMIVLSDYNDEDDEETRHQKKMMEDVFVKMYLKTKDAVVFRLSNRIVQVRFTDTSEILLSSEAKLVTYVSKYGNRQTFALESILENNHDPSISKRLKYTKNILFKLIKK